MLESKQKGGRKRRKEGNKEEGREGSREGGRKGPQEEKAFFQNRPRNARLSDWIITTGSWDLQSR